MSKYSLINLWSVEIWNQRIDRLRKNHFFETYYKEKVKQIETREYLFTISNCVFISSIFVHYIYVFFGMITIHLFLMEKIHFIWKSKFCHENSKYKNSGFIFFNFRDVFFQIWS